MSQQLVKKGTNGRMVNVNPKSWIEAIKDKNTGQTLVEILQGFNMYFLPYNGNTSTTRCLVPTMLRKKGLWITYVKYDGNVYTEWYAADELDDKSWGDSSNWRIGNNTLVGDITISANGNWVINGTETEFKAVGEKGNTPLLRVANNRLQVSYDLGDTYIDVTNNPVYTKFRWLATSGDTQANNVGRIQASTDEGKTWTNMSNDFTNNLHISRYIGVNESLPTSGIAEGTIYAKGPTYAEDDTLNENPIYRLWVYAWKGNTLAWQDNGEFQSIVAGVVQETGDSENVVMSQKAVTENYSQLNSKLSTLKKESLIPKMGVVWNYEGTQKTIITPLWGASVLIPLDALYIGESGYSWITGGGMSGYEGSLPAVVMFDKDKQFLGYIQAVKRPNKLDLTEFIEGTKYIGFNSDNINTTIDALKGEQLAMVIWNDINEQRQSINMANSDLVSIKEQTQELRTLKHDSIIPQMGVVWDYEGNKRTTSNELWGASVLIPIDALYVGSNGFSYVTNGGILGYENSFPAVVMFDKNKNFLGYIQNVKQTNKLDLLEFVEGTMYIGINSDNINTTIDALKGEQIVRTIWDDINEQKEKTDSISTELLSAKEQLQKFSTLKYESLIPKMGVVWDYEGNQKTLGAPLWGASVLVPLDALYIEEGGYSWITGGGMLGYENSFPAVVMFDMNKQFLGYIQNVKMVNKLDLTEFVEGTKYIGFNSDGINTTIDALRGEQLARKIWDDIHSMQPSSTGIAKTNTLLYSSKTMLSGNSYSEVIPVSAEKNQTLYIGAWIGDYTQYGATINVYGVTGSNRTLIVQNGVINRQVIAATFKERCDSIEIESNTLSSSFVHMYIWGQYNGVLNVAASNAPVYEKENAHIICDGVNDEDDLQCAAELSGWVGFVNLSRGTFYVDSFKTRGSGDKVYGAIVKPTYIGFGFDFTLRGVSKSRAEDYTVGTRIVVRDSAYDNIPDGIEPCVIGSPIAQRAGKMRIEKIAIELESNTHPICIINGQYLGGLIVDSCVLSGGKNAWSDTPPTMGTVGIRGIMGDCDGSDYVLSNTYAIALYEGFQLGGEHLFAYELGTRFCYYGYTFGNYDYGSWFGSNPVTLSHPLTLINCCDEGSRKLPLFAKCGVHNLEGEKAKQQVDLINFNVEIHTSQTGGAEELTEGSFCGNIDFTSYGTTNSGIDTSTGLRHNRVDTKFWKEGSGRCFRTRNMTHELMGATSVRNGYFPTFMQRYFDTDLKKEIICIDEFTNEWVDSNGNKV